jgi:hypothetical protein
MSRSLVVPACVASAALLASACGSDFLLGYENGPATSSSTSSSSGAGIYSEASASGAVYSSGAASSSSSTGSSGSAGSSSGGSVTGLTGGRLARLSFAVVGGSVPANDFVSYAWEEVDTFPELPAFAVTTGNYGADQAQVAQYLDAQKVFPNLAFPAMGVEECTGLASSNCGLGNADGFTTSYSAFLKDMLSPLGVTRPYYRVEVTGLTGAWSAKLVFIAANAWDATQATWLDAELSKPTKYTFVVRSEPSCSIAPGAAASDAIVAQHPYTVMFVGSAFPCDVPARQVVVSPPSASGSCSYVIVQQRRDGAVVLTTLDCMKGVQTTVALNPDGSPV